MMLLGGPLCPGFHNAARNAHSTYFPKDWLAAGLRPSGLFPSGAVIEIRCPGSAESRSMEGHFVPLEQMPGLHSPKQGPRGHLAVLLGHGMEAGLLGPPASSLT